MALKVFLGIGGLKINVQISEQGSKVLQNQIDWWPKAHVHFWGGDWGILYH